MVQILKEVFLQRQISRWIQLCVALVTQTWTGLRMYYRQCGLTPPKKLMIYCCKRRDSLIDYARWINSGSRSNLEETRKTINWMCRFRLCAPQSTQTLRRLKWNSRRLRCRFRQIHREQQARNKLQTIFSRHITHVWRKLPKIWDKLKEITWTQWANFTECRAKFAFLKKVTSIWLVNKTRNQIIRLVVAIYLTSRLKRWSYKLNLLKTSRFLRSSNWTIL